MDFQINIGYEQLLSFLKQLTIEEKKKFVAELQKEFFPEKKTTNKLQQILLKGPTWSDKEYQRFCSTRDQINHFSQNDSH